MTAENKNQYALLQAQLRALWGTEQAILKVLPALIGKAHDIGLKNILGYHFAETLNQTSALRGIFKQLELSPKGEASKGFEDMLNDEASTLSSEFPGHAMDLRIISAARQVEQYEIAQYKAAVEEAEMQGLTGVRKTLLVSLNEEKLAHVKLDFLEKNINELASHEQIANNG
jgi:ferritin-like metal-binding protein YciE